jgi:hypothetical protein
MTAYRVEEVWLHGFVIHVGAVPVGRNPGTHCKGGWVDLRAGLDVLEKKNISFPYWESNSATPML